MGLFKKYPIKTMIFKRYGNALKPVLDLGSYRKTRIKTMDGFIENNYFELKFEKIRIPTPDIVNYQDIDGKRWVYWLQVDRDTFFPISFEAGKMKVKIPICEIDPKTKQPKLDENKKPIIKYEERVLFNSRLVMEGDVVTELPTMIATKTYDKEHWLSSEIETAQRLYRKKAFWEQYGNVVMMMISGIIIIGIAWVVMRQYGKMNAELVEGLKVVAQSNGAVAERLSLVAKWLGENVTSTVTAPY